MLRKIVSILFVVASGVVFLLPFFNIVADAVIDDYQMKDKSRLEGRSYEVAPQLTWDSFSAGTFQDGLDQYLADSIPKRDGVLMWNAAIQRKSIEASNFAFRFPVYHSFYGSERVCVPEYEAIVEEPFKATDATPGELDKIASAIKVEASKCSDVRWGIALVDRAINSHASPVHDYVSSPEDYQYLKQEFFSRLPESFVSLDLSIDDSSEYFSKYFKADHHWRVEGALDCYTRLMESFGEKPIEYDLRQIFGGPQYGANARNGLCDEYSDSLNDVLYNDANLKIQVNGKKKKATFLNKGFARPYDEYEKTSKFDFVYSGYFHGDYGEMHIENKDLPEGKSLLIVGDSYTDNCELLYAMHYRDVYVVDLRYVERDKVEWGGVGAYAKKHHIDDAVYLCSRYYLRDFYSKISPQ